MSAAALWAPLEVPDLDAAAGFYGGVLGLPLLDEWSRDGERGAVFGVGGSGRIEVVQTDAPTGPPPVALELPTWADVDAMHAAITAARAGTAAAEHRTAANADDRDSNGLVQGTPEVFPRGHYGFVTTDPAGNAMLVWSER